MWRRAPSPLHNIIILISYKYGYNRFSSSLHPFFRSFFCSPPLNRSGNVKLLIATSPRHLRFPVFLPNPPLKPLRDIVSNIRSRHNPCRFPKQTLSLVPFVSPSFFSSSHGKNVHNSHFRRCSCFPCFNNQQCLSCRRLSKNLCCWE